MNLKKQAINGATWNFVHQFSVQAINFGVQIILARLLLPKMFGLVAMLSVFVAIGHNLMDGGMTTSLIRTNKPDQLDYSTVFITNFMTSVVVYLITFFAAPFIAEFYDQEILKNILRVYALTFVVRSLAAVHVAKLTKEMNFKQQMKLEVPATMIGGIVGISMAFLEYGVWSLVWLNVSQAILFTIQTWIFVQWKPSLIFNRRRFKYHFNFGYKMTLSGLLDKIYKNAYNIVIGKAFSPATVGYFFQAERMRLFPVGQVSAVMGKVTYPLFSSIREDVGLKRAYKATMKLCFFLVVPIMMSLIVGGKELFLFLFGEKWVPAVPYFQILAFASIVQPIASYNLNILKVKSRSDLFLKLEIIKKILGAAAIALALPFGMTALIVTYTVVFHLMTFLDMIFSGKLIAYPFWEQVKDCSRIYLVGVSCLLSIYLTKDFLLSNVSGNFAVLLMIFFVFIIMYFLLVYLLDKDMVRIVCMLRRK